jgi:hypothetical protein
MDLFTPVTMRESISRFHNGESAVFDYSLRVVLPLTWNTIERTYYDTSAVSKEEWMTKGLKVPPDAPHYLQLHSLYFNILIVPIPLVKRYFDKEGRYYKRRG